LGGGISPTREQTVSINKPTGRGKTATVLFRQWVINIKKMKTTKWLLLASLALAGCSQEDITTDLASGDETAAKEGITMTVKDFETDRATRTALTLDETTGLKFTWAESDLVGVFGSQDDQQVKLTIKSGADSNEATFTSSDFQLSPSSTYRAYFPMTDANTASSSEITLDYTEQKQTENASTAHLGAYDFLVSDKVTPTATNTAAFNFSHLGAAVRLRITLKNVPEINGLKYTTTVPWAKVKLSTTDGSKLFITKGTLDLFGDKEIKAAETASSVELWLGGDIESGTGEHTIDLWLMLAPTDLSGKTINVSMHADFGETYGEATDEGIISRFYLIDGDTDIDGKNFKAGCAYSLPVTIDKWTRTKEDESEEE